MVFVVGLGGVTSSGKTTMCQELLKYLSTQYSNVRVVDLDSYARDENDSNHVHLEEFNHQDWESLSSLHVDRFVSDVKSIINDSNNSILIIEDLNFDECRKRRSQRTYNPPDPPHYFDRHIWPMYLIAKKHAFNQIKNLIHIDSTQPVDEIFHRIINDINKGFKN